MSQVAHQTAAYPNSHSTKQLGVFLFPPLDGMLVHRRVTPSIKFAGTHLYTWVERGTVRIKCLAQEPKLMSPARAQTQTVRFQDIRALTMRSQHLRTWSLTLSTHPHCRLILGIDIDLHVLLKEKPREFVPLLKVSISFCLTVLTEDLSLLFSETRNKF